MSFKTKICAALAVLLLAFTLLACESGDAGDICGNTGNGAYGETAPLGCP